MKVKIEIFTHGGEDASFTSQGTLTCGSGGFCVEYALAGDSCTLSWDGKTLTQCRRGHLCTDMSFREGCVTDCSLTEEGAAFPFTVHTRVLGVSFGEDGCTAALEYRKAGDEVNTELIFKAERVREPNGRREPRTRPQS